MTSTASAKSIDISAFPALGVWSGRMKKVETPSMLRGEIEGNRRFATIVIQRNKMAT